MATTIEVDSGKDITITPAQENLLIEAYTSYPVQIAVDGAQASTFWALEKKGLIACTVGPREACDITGRSDKRRRKTEADHLADEGIRAVGMPTPFGARSAHEILKAKGKKPKSKVGAISKEYDSLFGKAPSKKRKTSTGGSTVTVKKGPQSWEPNAQVTVDVVTPAGRNIAYVLLDNGRYVMFDEEGVRKSMTRAKFPKYVQKHIDENRESARNRKRAKAKRSKRTPLHKQKRFFSREKGYGIGATRNQRRSTVRAAFRAQDALADGLPRLSVLQRKMMAYVASLDAKAEMQRGVNRSELTKPQLRALKFLMDTDLVFYDNVNYVTARGYSRPVHRIYTFRLTPQGRLFIRDFLHIHGDKLTPAKVKAGIKAEMGAKVEKEVAKMVKDTKKTVSKSEAQKRAAKPKSKKGGARRGRKKNPMNGEITVMASDARMRRAIGRSALNKKVKVGDATVHHVRGGLYQLTGPGARALKVEIELTP